MTTSIPTKPRVVPTGAGFAGTPGNYAAKRRVSH
jgi:hypothetical protein